MVFNIIKAPYYLSNKLLWHLKKEKCDVCKKKFRNFNLLHNNNFNICSECAAHMNDMREV